MKRDVSLEEISDGKLYELNDLVKVGCNDCDGCSDCCNGMGNSVILDPYDIHRMVQGLGISFEGLLQDKIQLNVVDGIILPNLSMKEPSENCGFLDSQGRCSIHAYRPGICRLFPLGRVYENRDFKYFLQTQECKRENPTKVKVKKWINTPDVHRYHQFINQWHYLLEEIEEIIADSKDETLIKNLNMYLLTSFYIKPFAEDVDFYNEFDHRVKVLRETLFK